LARSADEDRVTEKRREVREEADLDVGARPKSLEESRWLG
jgi:hypothetical protein